MIHSIVLDSIGRHKYLWGLAVALNLLLGLFANDAEALFAFSSFLGIPWLWLYIVDRKQGQAVWQTLPIVYKRLAPCWIVGGAATALSLYAIHWLGMFLSLFFRWELPRDFDIYAPASLWSLPAGFGMFSLVWALRPPEKEPWPLPREFHKIASGVWVLLWAALLGLTFLPTFWLGKLNDLSKSGVPWIALMACSIVLAVLGGWLFILRERTQFTFNGVQSRRDNKSFALGPCATGFRQLTQTVLLRGIFFSIVVLFMIFVFHYSSSNTPSLRDGGNALFLPLMLMWIFPALLLWSNIQPLSNLRILPLTASALCARLVVLFSIAFFTVPLAAAVLYPLVFLDLIDCLPFFYSISLLALFLLLGLKGKKGVYALVILVQGYFLLSLTIGPVTLAHSLRQPWMVWGSFTLIMIEIFILYWLIGHTDAPYPSAVQHRQSNAT